MMTIAEPSHDTPRTAYRALIPLAALVAFGDATAQASWVPRAGGAVLLVAGLYQFTAWKDACLRA